MKRPPKFGSRILRRVILVTAVAGITAIAVAKQVTVKQELEIKAEKKALADPVDTVAAITTLEVLAEEGGWVKVRTPGGKIGYVAVDDLPADTNVAGVTGDSTSSGLSTSAAGKGLQEDALAYAKNRHLDRAPLEEMIIWGKQVTAKDLREFTKAGGVGPK